MIESKPNKTRIQMEVPFLDLRAGFDEMSGEIRTAIEEVISSQQFVLGPQNEALEREIAAYCDTQHGVGLANGTDALTLALAACGVGPGDEVMVPALTFVATATAVVRLATRPIFADVDAKSLNLDPAEMDSIREIASRHGMVVIEDNAQAIGARYKGQRTGSLGAAAGISFYPTKNLGAYGDAGMLVTNSVEIEDRVRRLRNHGQTGRYSSSEPGWNSRLDEIQAAVLRVKLRRLDVWTEKRQSHAKRYNELLSGLPDLILPCSDAHSEPVYHLYTIRIKNHSGLASRRDRVHQLLETRGIGTSVYYPIPLPFQPLFSGQGYRAGDFPVTELAASQVLSLPLYPELSNIHIGRVVEELTTALKETS
jgi:dTDP-4-amino-4,6-dideoxygalactose transaminase